VLGGAAISSYVRPTYVSYAAGIGFILIGACRADLLSSDR